ncbi:MAG TPA: sensor histidine kinase [Rhizobiaceae bacterium]|nr:sensor histidine kinase [Rhizobiaceae bacterium]
MQRTFLRNWASKPLAAQFLVAGGLVSLAAMLFVGAVVSHLIEENVTRNSGAATALYVDSVIAPLLPDMQRSEPLSDTAMRALDETLGQGALGKRLFSFRLWREDGTILYSNIDRLVGKRFPLSDDLKTAFSGKMVAEFDNPDDVESVSERASGKPLLEIYNPVLQPWSGEVVAVSEFYEIATDFEKSLAEAQLKSWLAVASVTLCFFLLLSAIVFRGSRTIERQARALKDRVRELSSLLTQNRLLSARLRRASQRATALNESYLRRIGADLHDGPAQLVALASLRMDSAALTGASDEKREQEIAAIKTSLDEAMREIRSICNGLVLPHIEQVELPEILKVAVRAHEQRTQTAVALTVSDTPQVLSPSEKICVYRFVQEALNNGFRHGGGVGQKVTQWSKDRNVIVEVADTGSGFDPKNISPKSLGLAGLRERVESLGGRFSVKTSSRGTTVTMSLGMHEHGAHEMENA